MRPDDILLVDMLLAARDAVEFLKGKSPEEFARDRMCQLAVIKSIETVGEAASRISEPFRETHPQLPWQDIVGMRHRLVHGYFDIDLDRVWRTVQEDLPPVIALIETLVPQPEA